MYFGTESPTCTLSLRFYNTRHGDRTPITSKLGTKYKQSEQEHAFWMSKVAPDSIVQDWGQFHPTKQRDGHQEEPFDANKKPNAMLTTIGAQHVRDAATRLRAK